VYVAADVHPDDLPGAVAGLRALGFLGANVTVPHKRAVRDLVGGVSAEAEAVGAVNTLHWREGRLLGDNTDARGLEWSLREEVGLRPGEQVLVFGAGGAARAAAVALGRLGAAVRVRARRPAAAAEIDELARAHGAVDGDPRERPGLVVNATPLGLHGEALPDDLMALEPGQVALDLIYRPTPFLATATERGARAVDGLGMLVGQAAASFERWTGVDAPLDALWAAARSATGRAAS
jgi:shikimate dehydrogenase